MKKKFKKISKKNFFFQKFFFFQNFFLNSQNFGKVRPFSGEKELHSWCEKKNSKKFQKNFFLNSQNFGKVRPFSGEIKKNTICRNSRPRLLRSRELTDLCSVKFFESSTIWLDLWIERIYLRRWFICLVHLKSYLSSLRTYQTKYIIWQKCMYALYNFVTLHLH